MPSADGHAPQASHQKSLKNQPRMNPFFRKQIYKNGRKIHQVGSKNLQSWSPKSSKIGALGRLGGVWGPSWAILDHLGPKMAPRAHKNLQKLIVGPPLDPPSWSQNPPKFDLEAIKINKQTCFVCCFFNRLLVDFERIWRPKSLKNQSKIDNKSIRK